jgi:hypothetical protein
MTRSWCLEAAISRQTNARSNGPVGWMVLRALMARTRALPWRSMRLVRVGSLILTHLEEVWQCSRYERHIKSRSSKVRTCSCFRRLVVPLLDVVGRFCSGGIAKSRRKPLDLAIQREQGTVHAERTGGDGRVEMVGCVTTKRWPFSPATMCRMWLNQWGICERLLNAVAEQSFPERDLAMILLNASERKSRQLSARAGGFLVCQWLAAQSRHCLLAMESVIWWRPRASPCGGTPPLAYSM